jgi:hypothetical protein
MIGRYGDRVVAGQRQQDHEMIIMPPRHGCRRAPNSLVRHGAAAASGHRCRPVVPMRQPENGSPTGQELPRVHCGSRRCPQPVDSGGRIARERRRTLPSGNGPWQPAAGISGCGIGVAA